MFRNGQWLLRNSNSGGGVDISFNWGAPGDVPIVGDWDGDGDTTIGVWRASTFFLRNTNSAGGVDASFSWGVSTDLPIAGDWDGDGDTTIGVFRAGTWFIRNTNSGGGVDATFGWGVPTDVPLVGDWDGTNSVTPGIRRGATFFQRNANTSGPVDTTFAWGLPTDAVGDRPAVSPVPGGSFQPLRPATALYAPPGSPCLAFIDPAFGATSATCTILGSIPYSLMTAIGAKEPSPFNPTFSGGVFALVGSYAIKVYTFDSSPSSYSGMSALGTDLTGDGIPELLIGARRQGTGQILEYSVLSGFPYLIGARDVYKGVLTLSASDLLEFQPVYGPSDPNCCPSGREQIRVRVVNSTLSEISRLAIPLSAGAGPSIF